MQNVTVKLSRSYENPHAGGTRFDSVVLREPTYSDVYASGLGRPFEFHPTPGGVMIVETRYQAIGEYIDRLAVEPPAECLSQLSAVDAMRLQRAITDFFREPETSTESPDGSSSLSGSTSEQSPE